MSRQARLGILVVSAVAVFIAMLFLVARRATVFGDTFLLSAEFGYVGGLKAGAPVTYRGIDVGTVEQVRLPELPTGPIRVDMLVQKSIRSLLRSDSRARILSAGVLGNQMIALTAGSEFGAPVADGIPLAGEDPTEVLDLVDSASQTAAAADSVIRTLNRLLTGLEQGRGSIGQLFTDPSAHESALRVAAKAEQTLDEARFRLNDLTTAAESTLASLDTLIDTLRHSDGTAARLLHDPLLYDRLTAVGEATDRLVSRLDGVASDAEIAADWGILALYRASEALFALRRHPLLRRYFRETNQAAIDSTFKVLETHRMHLRERESALRASSQGGHGEADGDNHP